MKLDYMTYREALQAGIYILTESKVQDPTTDAKMLLQWVCKIDATFYYMHQDDEMSEDDKTQYRIALSKRVEHIPLQYILGEQYFCGFPFKVNSAVLIPRLDTEVLVEEVLKGLKAEPEVQNPEVLDLCTGSGCIIVALKKLCPSITAYASDVSKAALLVAKENAKLNHADVEFVCGNLFDKWKDKRFDVIVSNPPYIPGEVIEKLDVEVKSFEPYDALYGGEDGLDFYRLIIDQAKDYLKPTGKIAFEIGHDQGESVPKLLMEAGYQNVEVKRDLAGLCRVVTANAPKMIETAHEP